jgi:phenylpropionate dioxygenase-like ring-hydroxylating dioxygenase large terminal subunit
MEPSSQNLFGGYDPRAPLPEASTVPASWYLDLRIAELEARTVFRRNWLCAGRAEQVEKSGQYVTFEVAREPLVVVRGGDGILRGFFNVCRHHAAAVLTEEAGQADKLRCPYHGWTYSLEGELKGTPDFAGVCNFDRSTMGLVPVSAATQEKWVFIKLDSENPSLGHYLGTELIAQLRSLHLENFQWFERRRYTLECNWKVFVDNYLDGGYHVPHVHRALDTVLDYTKYTIEPGERFCLQSSSASGGDANAEIAAVRKSERALYYWIYPNFMINWYEGVMDTNLVLPRGVDRTEVIFDFYFTDISPGARGRNETSIRVAEAIQQEDAAICKSVQRGLQSRAYTAGRLSVRREAGEHLFHRLLYQDLKTGIPDK